jgi:glycosyltransferase involved in cell wall biosynthesis
MSAAQPFFSVVVCTWNRAHLLPRALDSMLAQTEGSWEVLVVDDGSTDGTGGVVQKYVEADPRFRYLEQESRGGVANARNQGAQAARGTYITFLDSDDAYTPTHLALRHAYLAAHPHVELLHGGVEIIGDPYVPDKDEPSRLIHLSECVVGGTFVIHRDVFQKVGWFDASKLYADDADFFERTVSAGITTAYINEPTYRYFRNVEGQLTQSATGQETQTP